MTLLRTIFTPGQWRVSESGAVNADPLDAKVERIRTYSLRSVRYRTKQSGMGGRIGKAAADASGRMFANAPIECGFAAIILIS